MGRPKRLIIQADLTSEDDQAFLSWVKALRKRRRLADEIREGLRARFLQSTGKSATWEPELAPAPPVEVRIVQPKKDQGTAAARLKGLVQGF